jgi:hypothetical protein
MQAELVEMSRQTAKALEEAAKKAKAAGPVNYFL